MTEASLLDLIKTGHVVTHVISFFDDKVEDEWYTLDGLTIIGEQLRELHYLTNRDILVDEKDPDPQNSWFESRVIIAHD